VAKTQLLQSKAVNKDIEKTHYIILADAIVEDLRKQQGLIAAFSFDVAHPTFSSYLVERFYICLATIGRKNFLRLAYTSITMSMITTKLEFSHSLPHR